VLFALFLSYIKQYSTIKGKGTVAGHLYSALSEMPRFCKGRCGVFAGKTVWSTPERLRWWRGAIQIYIYLYLYLSEPLRHGSHSCYTAKHTI